LADNSVIGALRVTLGLDSAQFEDGLKRASDKLGGFGGAAKTHANGIGAALDSIFDRSRLKLLDTGVERMGLYGSALEKLGVVGIAAGVGIGAAALAFEGLNKNLEMADKLGKLAQQVGVPVEELSKLKYAAELADVGIDQLGGGLTKLAKNMSTVAETGKGPAANAFATLGVKVTNTNGTLRSSSDVMLDVAGKFSGMQDGATKTALAVAMFGKSGAELIPFLNEGKDGIHALMTEAEQLGVVISEKTAKQAEDFEDTLKRLSTAFQGAGMQITAHMAPGMDTLAHVLLDGAKNGNLMKTVVEALTFGLKALATVAVVAGASLLEAFQLGKGVVGVLAALGRGDVKAALAVNKATGQGMFDIGSAAAKTLKSLWTETGGSTSGAGEGGGRTGAPPVLRTTGSGKHGPTDDTASLDADIQKQIAEADKALAEARKRSLQAALQMATSDEARAELQRKIDQADYDGQIAGYDAQIAGYDGKIAAIKKAKLDTHAAEQIADLQALKSSVDIEKQLAASARVDREVLASAQEVDKLYKQQIDMDEGRISQRQQLLEVEASGLQSAYARAAIDLQLLQLDQERLADEQLRVDQIKDPNAKALAQQDIDTKRAVIAAQIQLKDRDLDLVNAVDEANSAAANFASALKSHNWSRVFASLEQTVQLVQTALRQHGLLGGFATAGSAVGTALSGFGGIAGTIGNGLSLGAGLSGAIAGLPGLAATLLPGLADSGALMTGLTSLAGLAGPIGIGIALIASLAPLFLGSKPSNHAGIATLTQDSSQFVSSGKETDETKQSVLGAAQVVLQGEAAIKAAGIQINTFVTKLDLGTRDMTHIFLSNGEELRSAVGDPADAANTALKALLEGATYVSDAQKSLVMNMLAAGKGFDDINAALQTYVQAQAIGGQLADAILKLQDPQSADLKGVHDAIDQQRQAYQALADQGYLTADQLAAIGAQLGTLEGLQVDDVMKRYAVAVTTATDSTTNLADAAQAAADAAQAAADALARQAQSMQVDLLNAQGRGGAATALDRSLSLGDLDPALQGLQKAIWAAADAASALQAAQQGLTSATNVVQQAYDRESAALTTTQTTYQNLADSLGSFLSSLGASSSGAAGYAALRSKLDATAMAAVGLDPTALGALPQVGRDFLAASKDQAKSALDFARDQARVRNAVEAGQMAAQHQVSVAQQQLDALKQMVSGIIDVNGAVISLAQAIDGYQSALSGVRNAQATAGGAGVLVSGAGGQPIIDQSGGVGVDALGIPTPSALQALGFDPATAADMYRRARQAQGLAFASGGSFGVRGPGGGDTVPVGFMANGGEMVNITHGDSIAALAAAMERQNGLLVEQNGLLRRTGLTTDRTHILLKGVVEGQLALTTTAG